MICRNDIEKAYVALYALLRNYIWDYDFVESLAYMEDATFDRFPDMTNLRNLSNKVYNRCRETMNEDEELKKRFDSYKKLIEDNDCNYSYIIINVQE